MFFCRFSLITNENKLSCCTAPSFPILLFDFTSDESSIFDLL